MNPSDALHARVVAFALGGDASRESFDELAVDIARFQAGRSVGFRRLIERSARPLSDAASIPAVPTDAFRAARVAVHPEAHDAVRFVTSGTTGAQSGIHVMRRTDTYRMLALASARPALLGERGGSVTVVALLPPPSVPPTSSLAFMAESFMGAWDGRPRGDERDFNGRASWRWLLGERSVDLRGLESAVQCAWDREEPLLLVATSFALVYLLEALGGKKLRAPPESTVMYTGGFKGRARSIAPEALVTEAAQALGIAESHVVGEYGMTELSSQLYEGVLSDTAWPRGVYSPPPWLRVSAVDPVTLEPVADGQEGLARFVDLGNVDSAVAVVTQDRVRREPRGWRLLGRSPGAPQRGCSLAVEQWMTEVRADDG